MWFPSASFYTIVEQVATLTSFFLRTLVDVLAPALPLPVLTIPICALIVLNLLMHYYYCITVRPGFVDGDGQTSQSALRDLGTVNSIFWATRKGGAKGKARALRSPPPRVTPACHTRCTKCNMLRPEVSSRIFFLLSFLTLTLRGPTIVKYVTDAY